MARIRNASASPTRKSPSPSKGGASSTQRLQTRETSPGKNVHFGRGSRLFSPPSAGSPERRSMSPVRSAMRPGVGLMGDSAVDLPYDHMMSDDSELLDDLSDRDSGSESSEMDVEEDFVEGGEKVVYQKARAPGVVAHEQEGEEEEDELESDEGEMVADGQPARTMSATMRDARYANDTRKKLDDQAICEQLNGLKKDIALLVSFFPNRRKSSKEDPLSALLVEEHPGLVRYIGRLAMGGSNGEEGLRKLFEDDLSRKALVWGIVGAVLKESVFDELYFGGEPELVDKLTWLDRDQASQDGFYRQRTRADFILKQRRTSQTKRCFDDEVTRIVLALQKMLLPLWCLGDGTKATWQKGKRNDGMYGVLHSTVVSAGDLAQAMRQSRDTIYYWPATFKDEEFEPSHMECINVGEMIRDSPYDKQTSGGRDLPILRAGTDHRKQAIVRVVCFPGLEVYRQGGGELAKQQLKAEKNAPNEDNAPPDVMRMRRRVTNKYGQEYTGKEGFRTRVLCKSVVLLEWGKQRLLTREAGTSAHIAAVKSGKLDKYEEDSAGSVELWDLFKRDVLDVRRDQQPSPVQRKGSGLFESARQAIAPWLGQAAADREIDEVKARYKEMMDATKQVAQAPRSPQSKKRKARAMEE